MKNASPALIALLNGGNGFLVADLYTFTLSNGTVLRMTSADVPIAWGGNTFATRPLITRGKCSTVIGVEVDTLDLSILPQPTELLNGVSWQQAVRQGALDGAWVKVERAYFTSWQPPVPVGTLIVFYGLFGDIDILRTTINATVNSALYLLNVQMPRNLFQATCLNVLYDTSCAASKASFTATGSVASAASVSGFATALGQPDGYFAQGVLTFTSGANVGLSRTVKSYVGGAFAFASPWPTAPANGDAFSVFAGCDKTQATCAAKFANLARFRGFPEIPVPETTY